MKRFQLINLMRPTIFIELVNLDALINDRMVQITALHNELLKIFNDESESYEVREEADRILNLLYLALSAFCTTVVKSQDFAREILSGVEDSEGDKK